MSDERAWKEEMTRLLKLLLERMDSLERTPPASRPTEIIPKTSLEIIREIKEHSKDCREEMERLIRSISAEIARKELNGLRDKVNSWEGKIFEAGRDATKTATGQVTTIQGELNILKTTVDRDHGGRIKVMEAWIDGKIKQEQEAATASRWSFSTVLQTLGIVSAFLMSAAALLAKLIMG
jgi:hypothetical protein